MSRHIGPRPSSPGQEGGEKLQSLEITADFLTDIITSQDFLLRLGNVCDIAGSLREAGFVVGFHLDTGEIFLGKIVDAKDKEDTKYDRKSYSGFSMPRQFEKSSLRRFSKGVISLISLHAHPGEICAPSLGDLTHLLNDRSKLPSKRKGSKVSLYPIMMIAAPFREEGQETVQLILFQEKPGTPRRSNEYDEEYEKGESEVERRAQMLWDILQNEIGPGFFSRLTEIRTVQQALNKLPGMNVAWLSFSRKRTSPEESLTPLQSQEEIAAILKDFAFTPKRVSKEE